MNTRICFILAIIIVVVLGAAFFFWGGGRKSGPADDSSGLIIGHNAIYVAEQLPGRSVSVSVVRIEKPGFVVIHEDAGDAPGKILGVSNLLPAGETKNLLPIMLLRVAQDGEIIYAMLHVDNGDGVFDAEDDKPVFDSVDGTPMMMIVAVSKDATEPGIVNP
ncbi:MAG: hypothetical protein U1A25_02820 [Candidatus Sungbacteria bacterium]|nr:hypothetical protein [bacterium]MDZ4260575.1 hypothetical protein [Candidatus Sungbacteria bacterium]